MLDIRRIRETPEEVRAGVGKRGNSVPAIDAVLEHDRRRRELLTEVEGLKSERNRISKQIGARRKRGEDTAEIQAQVRSMGEKIAALDADVRGVEEQLHDQALRIPNIPHESVPVGSDESANVEVRRHGEPPVFAFQARTHVDLGEHLGILDLRRAAGTGADQLHARPPRAGARLPGSCAPGALQYRRHDRDRPASEDGGGHVQTGRR